MAGSVLIWAPPGRGRRVPGATPFLGGKKAPQAAGARNSKVLNKNGPFEPPKNPGACFWGRKKTLREWGHAIPRFSKKTDYFRCRKTQGPVFGGGKNPCGKHADSHPGFGQGPVSNLILKIKYLGKGSNLPLHTRYRGHSVQANHGQRERIKQGCSPPGKSPSSVLAGVRTRCLRGASSVCQPTGQSDDGGPFGCGIP